jgi:Zn-finger nucleic acid-binding protein
MSPVHDHDHVEGTGPCPGCRSELWPEKVVGLRLDRCAGCGGLWFDEGELASFAGELGHGALKETSVRHVFKATGDGPRPCPRCAAPALRGGTAGAVEVDLCDGCGGFFLGKDSLGKLSKLAGGSRAIPGVGFLDGIDLGYLGRLLRELLD